MRTNVAPDPALRTHEGAPAHPASRTPEAALRRSLMSCLLWEREFYEDGEAIGQRLARLAGEVAPERVAALAVEARRSMHLRHAPLLVLAALSLRRDNPVGLVRRTVPEVVRRADEPGELLALVWRLKGEPRNAGGQPKVPKIAALFRGIADTLPRFDEYQLAKYDRPGLVRLRDLLRMVSPKPKDEAQAALWGRVVRRELARPDTWEVALSAGGDKCQTFTRLLREGRLGYLALLRNLRTMTEAGVDRELIEEAILARRGAGQVLPFRFVAAARACPQLEPALDLALQAAIGEMKPLPGRTAILVDVSGSMRYPLSRTSDLMRMDAAAALAAIWPGAKRLFSFSQEVVEVPPRIGMAGVDALLGSQDHGGTWLGQAVAFVNAEVPHDRLVVITDEQSHDRVLDPVVKPAYMVNVASNRNGVGYGRWTHIDGFSEAVIRFIDEHERAGAP